MDKAVDISGKLVLVTGASGTVGSRVARRLVAEGARVRALVRRSGPCYGLEETPVEYVLGDLTDSASVRRAIAGTEVVVHCAAALATQPDQVYAVNAEGGRNLADAAMDNGCKRFVHLSSGAVYDMKGHTVLDETTPLQQDDAGLFPHTKYAASKVAAEQYLRSVGHRLPFTILRLAAVLGAHPTSYYGVAMLQEAGRGSVVRGWTSSFDYVVADNVGEAVVLALRSPAAVGEPFNVVDGHLPTLDFNNEIRGWLEMELLTELKAERIIFPGTRFASVLGYSPRVTYQEVMAEMRRFAIDAGIFPRKTER